MIGELIRQRDALVAQQIQLRDDALSQVRSELDRLQETISNLNNQIIITIDKHVAAQRRDKPTGAISFEDGGFKITQTVPKKVEWDQTRLAEVHAKIKAAGDDPSQYINLKYSVAERKYDAWPDAIKAQFLPARTLNTGKPTVKIKALED